MLQFGIVTAALGVFTLGLAVYTVVLIVGPLIAAVLRSRSPRVLLGTAAAAYLSSVLAVGGNFLICMGVTTAIGGSATNGSVEANGSCHLSNHSLVTPVSATTYWRVYRYETITHQLFDVAFATGMVGILAASVARWLGWLPPTTDLRSLQGALELAGAVETRTGTMPK